MLEVTNLTKRFGDKLVLDEISFKIPDNKITVILGPSGCGKTTFLNICSNLIIPSKGKIKGLQNKKFSFVFQESRLLPFASVKENIDIVLKSEYPNSKNKRETIIQESLEKVGLIDEINSFPNELSGGMRQRVSIARAFAYKSEILFMDEPFRSLDLELKLELISTFKKTWKTDKRTVILVTHSERVAAMLGDQIVLLNKEGQLKTIIKNPVPQKMRSITCKDLLYLEHKIIKQILL